MGHIVFIVWGNVSIAINCCNVFCVSVTLLHHPKSHKDSVRYYDLLLREMQTVKTQRGQMTCSGLQNQLHSGARAEVQSPHLPACCQENPPGLYPQANTPSFVCLILHTPKKTTPHTPVSWPFSFRDPKNSGAMIWAHRFTASTGERVGIAVPWCREMAWPSAAEYVMVSIYNSLWGFN